MEEIMGGSSYETWCRNSGIKYRWIKKLSRRTGKFMTMHGALNSKKDADRVYVSRETGGRGLISFGGCIGIKKQLGMVSQEFSWVTD